MSKPVAPTLWRVTATMKANSAPSTLFQATVNVPNVLTSGESQYLTLQLNYPFIIEDGYINSTISPDAQLVIVANDGKTVKYSNKLNDTLVQSGRPRIPLFDKPLLVPANTKLQLFIRNLDAVGSSDVSVTVYLKVRYV